jgi:hypothetical protein
MPGSNAGNYLRSLVPTRDRPTVFFSKYVLNAAAESLLLSCAREDALQYVYNAVLSFLGGIGGLNTRQAAWAVTKMYYVVFYVGRAALCRAQHVIFHVPRQGGNRYTQYEIRIAVGQKARIVDKPPSTHRLVAERFQQTGYPVFMRGLTIDGVDPIRWLMDQREYWQYRAGRFSDPDLPRILDQIDTTKIQRLLAEYAADSKGVYLSDPAHAVVCVPFRLVEWALSKESLLSPGIVSSEDLRYLRKRCCIGSQTLTPIGRHL